MKRRRLLLLSPYPREGASVRYRWLQYRQTLAAAGLEMVFHPFMFPAFYRIRRRFGAGWWAAKMACALLASARLGCRLAALGTFHLVVVHREAFPLGQAPVERFLGRQGIPLVYDFDDAIFAPPTAGIDQRRGDAAAAFARRIEAATLVLAGNDFLADAARRQARPTTRIVTLPTAVDTERLTPAPPGQHQGPPVIGWVGNWGNGFYLQALTTVLERLGRRHEYRLHLVGGDDIFELALPGRVQRHRWDLATEPGLLREFDIGIMPLAGGVYDEGKCAFKILQYYALGIPVVASPTGCNRQVVEHGGSGFIAASPAEWYTALDRLLSDPDLRAAMGRRGRQLAEERFSTRVVGSRLLEELLRLADSGRP